MPAWPAPPANPTLHPGEVHVWRAALDGDAARVARLEQTLSEDERQRAGRFRFPRDRDHFIVARGVLRTILGAYLGLPSEMLRFQYGPQGKPDLTADTLLRAAASGLAEPPLCFNLSHSGGIVLYAVAHGREVGIDVEHIRADVVQEPVAERFFSPREVTTLRALPLDLQPRAFFACWTRKEAFVKARGEGLSLPLDAFDVSLLPGEPAALLGTRGDARDLSRWSFHELPLGPTHAAALVVEGDGCRLRCWHV
jgi:4'-phosphopantetheinyl transferase